MTTGADADGEIVMRTEDTPLCSNTDDGWQYWSFVRVEKASGSSWIKGDEGRRLRGKARIKCQLGA